MPKRSNPGALVTPTACVFTTQEQLYWVLNKFSDLADEEREKLLIALAEGVEEYYPKLAFNNNLYRKGTKSREALLKRFAESLTLDRMLDVLSQEDGAKYKEVVLKKLLTSRKWVLSALYHQRISWSNSESQTLVARVLIGIDADEAAELLVSSPAACNSKPEFRSKLIFALTYANIHVIKLLEMGSVAGEKCEQIGGLLTTDERKHLITLCTKSSDAAYKLLFPDSWSKRVGRPFNEAERAVLTKEEKEALASPAIICATNSFFVERNSDHRKVYCEEAEQLAKEFKAVLSDEAITRFKDLTDTKKAP